MTRCIQDVYLVAITVSESYVELSGWFLFFCQNGARCVKIGWLTRLYHVFPQTWVHSVYLLYVSVGWYCRNRKKRLKPRVQM